MKYRILKKYAAAYKKHKAFEAICKDLSDQALREISSSPGAKVNLDGVEFHETRKARKSFPKIKAILDKLDAKIKQLKKTAIETGEYKETSTPSFDAEIPSSAVSEVLAKSCPDYKKHFGIK